MLISPRNVLIAPLSCWQLDMSDPISFQSSHRESATSRSKTDSAGQHCSSLPPMVTSNPPKFSYSISLEETTEVYMRLPESFILKSYQLSSRPAMILISLRRSMRGSPRSASCACTATEKD